MFVAIADKFVSKEDKAKSRDGVYTVTLVVPPNSDLTELKAAIKAKAEEKWGKKLPGNLKSPIRKCSEVFTKKGDPKYAEEYQNHLQITANTYQQQPGVVDRSNLLLSKLQPGESTDELRARLKEECYSGRWMRISVSPAWYDNESLGVKLYLQGVQVLDHDERIGGRNTNAEDDFTPVGGGEDEGKVESSDDIFG
jgi:hypothetical protein